MKLDRYPYYVFWGHKNSGADFHYIYEAWSDTLKRLGAGVKWVDDAPENQSAIEPGCWVTVMDTACTYLPIVKDVDYVVHNFRPPTLDPEHCLTIQVYTNEVARGERWGRFCYFDGETLYEPWGTNLLPHEFMEPIWRAESTVVNWVGSVWNNELDQGNEAAIEELVGLLKERDLSWAVHRNVGPLLNAALVRDSRIAPAITGHWQAEVGYLPCRLFKNVSYGQLGMTNVHEFQEEIGSLIITDRISSLLDFALGLPKVGYIDLVRQQQSDIAGFDYATKMEHIFRAFDELKH